MIIDLIKALRQEHKDDRAGYREKQYHHFGKAMAIVAELKSNDKSKKAFYKLADKKLPKKSGAELRDNLTASLICYITCAKSESAVKQVWKKARALDYLAEEGVKPDDIAAEIAARGGIEKIVKAAAQEKPRRPKVKSGSKKKAKPALKKQLKMQSRPVEDDDEWPLDDDDNDAGDLVTITVQLRQRQVADILDFKKGQRMSWILTRVDDDNDDLAVAVIQEVRPL